MLRTKTLISELDEIPREWIFENYLNLEEKLTGQQLMVLSPFNPKDKRPSLSIFVSNRDNKSYMFRDFSTGEIGGPIDLIYKLFNLSSKGEAAHKVIKDYNQWLLTNKDDYHLREFKVRQKYKVKEFVKRGWNNIDQRYWTQFGIGSALLEQYNVSPLESYKMVKDDDDGFQEMIITGRHHIYGYFRADGTLYKIYQPMLSDNKFMKVREYIQGTDQLTFSKDYLIICSSLKDMLCLLKLGYKQVEVVAPDSENALIKPHVINAYRIKYKNICTLFDNDTAGIEAAKKYTEVYQIPAVKLELSKDLSDSVRDHSIKKVREVLTPLLTKTLKP